MLQIQNPAGSGSSVQVVATAVIKHSDGTQTLYQSTSDTPTNNGAMIQTAMAALAANEFIEIGPCAANISASMAIPSGATVVLNGTQLTNTVNNLVMFTAAGAYWSLIGQGSASLVGKAGGGAGNETGLLITPAASGNSWKVLGLNFVNWNYVALGFVANLGQTDHMNGTVSNVTFRNNGGIAIYIPEKVEYLIFSNITISSGGTGIYCAGGNNQFVGGQITDTTVCGFNLQSGNNNSHGSVSNFLINHNTAIGINLGAATFGEQFINCDLFSNGSTTNTISIGACSSIQFIGGILASEITFTSTPIGPVTFLNMRVISPQAAFLTYTDAQRSWIRMWDCVTAAGYLSGYPLGNDPGLPALGLRKPNALLVTSPGIAAGIGAGTSPTVSVVAGSTDYAGQISVLTGSAPSASAVIATLTFNSAFAATPNVILVPANAAAAALSGNAAVHSSSPGTSSFAVSVGSTNLAATTTYLWNYLVVG